ncbi:SGNH/GDSL hydrolase family protein [Actinoplanes sp. NPDC051513]|uniref:SGNH/GDSL hydrolase family protein n=1 Tax=Actinoplanes sp. NPDC051513 TaxID=3363908 RepID=UPI00378737FC
MRLPAASRARAAVLAGLLTVGTALAPASPAFAGEGPPPASDSGAGLRILPLGDSITFGKGDPAENGYRAALYSWLTQPVDFVGSQRNGATAHEGHPGWRIAQLTERIDAWMAEARPDVVLLDIGTNDLLRHDRIAEAPDRLVELIDHIVAANPQVRILLAELLVVDRGHEADFEWYNSTLPLMAALYPDNVMLVDMARVPVANTVDHVHPNALGYQQMAYQWYEALRGVLPQGRSWSPVTSPF